MKIVLSGTMDEVRAELLALAQDWAEKKEPTYRSEAPGDHTADGSYQEGAGLVAPAPPHDPPAAAPSELDSAGVAWDPKIHAKTKTQTKLGTWKFKPGLSPEQRAVAPAPPVVPAPPAALAPPVAPVAPAPPVAPDGGVFRKHENPAPQNMDGFLNYIAKLVGGGKTTHAAVQEWVSQQGVADLTKSEPGTVVALCESLRTTYGVPF